MRRPALLIIVAGVIVAGGAAGCAAATDGDPSNPEITVPSDDIPPTSQPPGDAPPPTSEPEPTEAARRDLAVRLGEDPANVTVVAFEQVTWSDGALGCPQPGMAYTQALVPGYRVVLALADVEYSYHGADGGEPFLCERPRPPAEGEPRARP